MKKFLKWTGYVIGGLLATVAGGLFAVSCVSESRAAERYDVTPAAVAIPEGEDALAEGQRLYRSRGCADCHTEDGGGKVVLDDAPGRFVGSNLTKIARDYDVVDFVRAVRHGVAKDGRPLVMMPSMEYWHMSDRDLGHIIAYVKTLPPVERELPPQEPRLLGKVLHVFEVFPAYSAELIDHDAPRPAEPAVGPTREYGAYLAVGTCVGCHGEGMSGGPIPGAPPDMGNPANLTPHETGLAGWSRDDFVRVMREGERPDGRQIATEQMPWENFRHFTDVELDALWTHLSSLPPRPHGNR